MHFFGSHTLAPPLYLEILEVVHNVNQYIISGAVMSSPTWKSIPLISDKKILRNLSQDTISEPSPAHVSLLLMYNNVSIVQV
jgi:hypothetical protein